MGEINLQRFESAAFDGLPFIDVQETEVRASPAATWQALIDRLPRLFGGRFANLAAAAMGCRERMEAPFQLAEAATLAGFRVSEIEIERTLRLEGRHRLSRYALGFFLDPAGPTLTRLRAMTHAAFPGWLGRVYRAIVIGTGGHGVVVRSVLGSIRRQAERAAGAAPAR
jgi:hypothetical protein